MIKWHIAQWMELRWWKNYLHKKDKTTYYAWKKKYWQQLIQSLGAVHIADSDTIADVGCGPAGVFILYTANKVTAFDPLLDSYATQLPFFDKTDYPHTAFINIAMENMPVDQKYDFVFCMNAINHVAAIDTAFDRLTAIAKKHLILSIDAHNFSFFKWLFRIVPGDILHPHQFDLAEYKKMLTDRNWHILTIKCVKKEFFFSHYVIVAEL